MTTYLVQRYDAPTASEVPSHLDWITVSEHQTPASAESEAARLTLSGVTHRAVTAPGNHRPASVHLAVANAPIGPVTSPALPVLVDRGDGIATLDSLRAVDRWVADRVAARGPKRHTDFGAHRQRLAAGILALEADQTAEVSGSTASARWLLEELPGHVERGRHPVSTCDELSAVMRDLRSGLVVDLQIVGGHTLRVCVGPDQSLTWSATTGYITHSLESRLRAGLCTDRSSASASWHGTRAELVDRLHEIVGGDLLGRVVW